jgi:hypothetical protein
MPFPSNSGRSARVSHLPAAWRFPSGSLLLLLWVLQSGIGTAASIVHVDHRRADATDNDGRSWSTAYGGVQEAIEAAQPGDELWVAAGIYYENVTVTPGLALYGGFAGTETHLSERDWVRHPSILDGRRAGSVIVVTGAESADSRIDGFTIQNGEAEYGGGLLIANASPVIANNLIRLNRATNGAGIWLAASGAVCEGNQIEYNTATDGGGGLAMTNGSVTIRSNVFLANEAYDGGAIDAWAGEPLIEWNRIQENRTSRSAGGVRLTRAAAVVRNNWFVANVTRAVGGGMACYGGGSARIANNLFLGNRLRITGPGVGLYFDADSDVLLVNNTILYNAHFLSPAVHCDGDQVAVVNNLIAFNHDGLRAPAGLVVIRNNCIFGNVRLNVTGFPNPTGSNGNISMDPRLVRDPLRLPFHPGANSPCLNAGDPDWVGPDDVDLDGKPRPWGGAVDIGSYEYTGSIDPLPRRVRHVRPDGDDVADGLSWATAVASIQVAMDSFGLEGGEVWVAEGLYRERVMLRYAVQLLGGFAGTELEITERDWRSRSSILDGEYAGSVIQAHDLPATNRIDGFVIRHGTAMRGGGIDVMAASVWIANNTILSNVASFPAAIHPPPGGAGLHVSSGSWAVVTNNLFQGNRAPTGAGLLSTGDLFLMNNAFVENVAEGHRDAAGGAIMLGQNPFGTRIRNNLFQGNVASGSTHFPGTGSAIRTTEGQGRIIEIVGNTFLENRVYPVPTAHGFVPQGGAVYHQRGDLIMANNLMVSNTAALDVEQHGRVVLLRNNCVHGNLLADYSGIPDPIGIDGNISADPRFTAWPDARLAGDSPCIDAGDTTLVDRGEVDLDGHIRIAGSAVDIGVHEFGSAPPFRLTLISSSDDVPFRLRLHGVTGSTYVFEKSDDVTGWDPFATNTAVGPEIEQTLEAVDGPARQYYRALLHPDRGSNE